MDLLIRLLFLPSMRLRNQKFSLFQPLWVIALACFLVMACTLDEVRLGEEYAEQGRWDEAVESFQKATKKEPFDDEILERYRELKVRAAEEHYAESRRWFKEKNLPAALQEIQVAVGLDPSNQEYHAALGDILRLKEGRRALSEAKNLHNLGRLDEALRQYERAIELDPELLEALEGITAVTQHQKLYQAIGESAEPVTLRFQNTRLKQVFEILARTAKIDILFDRDVRDDLVTIFTRDTPFNEALDLILKTNQLFARRVAPDSLLIIPDTKQKREQYQDLKIRTFYLSNSKAKDMANLLRTILETKRVYVNEPLNTVVVRDEPAKLVLAEQILLANDRTEAEVLFEVEILEINRTDRERLGFKFAKEMGFGAFPPAAAATSTFGVSALTWTFRELTDIGPDSYLFKFPSSFLFEFFKQESDAKTLASPKIRVLNNEKASINIGNQEPILLSTTNVLPGQAATGATPTTSTVTSIEFKDTGIKLTVEPRIQLNNDIILRLQIEIIRLGDRVILQNDPLITQFRFGKRTADTALNIQDGESVILAGLIQEDDRRTRDAVPGIDDIPGLRDLFSFKDTEKVITEIVLVITPHLVRNVNPPALTKQTLWSGTSKSYSTMPLFTEASVPLPPATEFQNGAQQSEQPSSLPDSENLLPSEMEPPQMDVPPGESSDPSFQSPEVSTIEGRQDSELRLFLRPAVSNAVIGEDIRIDLHGFNVPAIQKSQVTISYDPKIVDFAEVLEGSFWKENRVPSSLTVSAVPKKGQIVVQLGPHTQSQIWGGQLATLVFRSIASGNTNIQIQRPLLMGTNANPIPVIAQHGRISVQ